MEHDHEERQARERVEGAHAHNGNADSVDHSYATEDEEEAEEEEYSNGAPAPFQASWGFSTPTNSPFTAAAPFPASWGFSTPTHSPFTTSNFPISSPPPPDVKLSVISSSVAQPAFSKSKQKGSLFSLSSFYDASGTGRFQGAGHLKIIEAVLRSAAAVFSLISFCVMSSTREMRVAAGSTFEVKFSDFQAYNYLVVLNVLSFAYSSAQVVVVLQSSGSNTSIFASPLKSGLCKFLCDEILAFCLVSASSSAATATQLAHYGLRNIWPPACSTWKLWIFCAKADAAVVISFFSSFSVILSSLFSGFYLLRLIAIV